MGFNSGFKGLTNSVALASLDGLQYATTRKTPHRSPFTEY